MHNLWKQVLIFYAVLLVEKTGLVLMIFRHLTGKHAKGDSLKLIRNLFFCSAYLAGKFQIWTQVGYEE